jgi:hypothetical protein
MLQDDLKFYSSAQSIQSARLSLQSSELAPPTPLPASECCPPSLWFQEGDTLACGRGAGEPIRTREQTLWYSGICIIPLRLSVYTSIQSSFLLSCKEKNKNFSTYMQNKLNFFPLDHAAMHSPGTIKNGKNLHTQFFPFFLFLETP